MIIGIVIAVLIIGAIAISLIYKSPKENSPANQISTSTNIEIKNFAFNPNEVKIKKGETLTWTNYDSTPHTVTSDSRNELNSETLNKGDKYSHTFSEIGTFDYHCNFHTGMKGKVIVE